MVSIVIEVGKQRNGVTFQLSPWTEMMLASQLTSGVPPSSVFLEFEKTWSLEHVLGTMWSQVVTLLTGLDEAQIRDLGGFQFVDPAEDEVLFESFAA